MKFIKHIKHRAKNRFQKVIFSNAKNFKKCDFFVIGTMKGGTTALDAYFRDHPEVQMPLQKEVNLFDAKIYPYIKFLARNIHNIYYDSIPEKFKTRGEVTPNYIFNPEVANRIKKYNKKAKLIVLLRNPYERSFSQWNMSRLIGVEERSFHTAIKQELEETEIDYSKSNYLARSLYTKQLDIFLKHFNRDEILILKSESLLASPLSELAEVSKFLNIKPFEITKPKVVHKRVYKQNLDAKSFEIMQFVFAADLDKLNTFVNWDYSDWLQMKSNDN